VDRAVEERQKKTAAAPTWKLLVNSLYGNLILNKRKYENVRIAKGHLKRNVKIRHASFRSLQHVDGTDTSFIFRQAHKLIMDSPTHLGKTVLDLAKARMVDFYFEVIVPIGGVIVSMDTDSFTFHADADLSTAVPEAKREQWFDNAAHPAGPKIRGTPGLFHLESLGDKARAVGPKRVCVTKDGELVRVSHVGVKRDALPENPMQLYEHLCAGGTADVSVTNRRRVDGMYKLVNQTLHLKAK
jgi:hypothetical protein